MANGKKSSKKNNNGSKKEVKVGIKQIKPKTINQSKYVKSIKNNNLIFAIGPAGTGKTLLAVDYAIKEIIKGKYKKLIITRPVVEAGGEKIGFLPGDIDDKLDPYIRPIIDYVEDIIGRDAREWFRNHIEIAPLAFMRGRTFNDCFLIFDEAQNGKDEQIRLFLTRIGYGSKAIITADPSQSDLCEKVSGIGVALNVLTNKENISICTLDNDDIVRSDIVKTIVESYEEFDNLKCDLKKGNG